MQMRARDGGFVSHGEPVQGSKIRARSEKFFDHFSQAAMFFQSQSDPEKQHLIEALRFELGKLDTPSIRERMIGMLAHVDRTLAEAVAEGLGLDVPASVEPPLNHSIPADGRPNDFQPKRPAKSPKPSPALSMANTPKDSIETRKVAVLVADGVDGGAVAAMMKALSLAGATAKVVAPRLRAVDSSKKAVPVDFTFLTTASVLFDAVYVPGGDAGIDALAAEPASGRFVREAYRHCKPIAATGRGADFVAAALGGSAQIEIGDRADLLDEGGLIFGPDLQVGSVAKAFIAAMKQHRFWARSS
ncbi:MAG: catalase-related domain-containing protein [Gemmatimonadota bacterium]